MLAIKKYFLSALILNAMCLSAMDTDIITDVIVENICDTIDTKHLGMGEYTCCFKSLVGSCLALYKSSDMPAEKAADEIQKIESYIPINDNSAHVFEKLVAKHYYVHYLVEALIQEKIKEFADVKGSTIDQLLFPDFSTDTCGIKKMIYSSVCRSFFDHAGINEPVDPTRSNQEYKDIHSTILYSRDKTRIFPSFLSMSKDGKYLQMDDQKNDIIVWNMKNGNKPQLSQEDYDAIEWSSKQSSDYRIIDKTENYCALTNAIMNIQELIPLKINENKPTIVLYKRPKPISYLCQCALNNSIWTSEDNDETSAELVALQNSKSFKAIKGFPRVNLEKRIEKQKTNLSRPTQKISNITDNI